MKRVIITETQYKSLIESQILLESIFEVESVSEFNKEVRKIIRRMLLAGLSIGTIYSMISNYCDKNDVPENTKEKILTVVENIPQVEKTPEVQNIPQIKDEPVITKSEKPAPTITKTNNVNMNDWKLADTNTIATVYNAIPAQCNGDFGHTASMFRLDLYNVLSQRVIAMERTFMKELGVKYGDVVYITGTGKWDGVWQIQDTMNKRFAGKHKIDILVPENIKYGQWDNVNLYVLKDKSMTDTYKSQMAPQISEEKLKQQVKAKKEEFKNKKKNK